MGSAQLTIYSEGNAYLKEKIAKIKMIWFYNCKVRERYPRDSDLSLWKIEAIGKEAIQGKFTPNSKELYMIIEEVRHRRFMVYLDGE